MANIVEVNYLANNNSSASTNQNMFIATARGTRASPSNLAAGDYLFRAGLLAYTGNGVLNHKQ